nr:peptidyl-tRNA hydrolase ICT1, mitochondrial [Ipomoea trifida]
MAAMRATTSVLSRGIFRPQISLLTARFVHAPLRPRTFGSNSLLVLRTIYYSPVLCKAHDGSDDDGKKSPARMAQVQQLIYEATERAQSAGNEPIPKITIVNTKVDMRFNVQNAHWLSERVRERIIQMEKNRINKDGELVISSTKTRTQKGNIEDALSKLQIMLDARIASITTTELVVMECTIAGHHRCCFVCPTASIRRASEKNCKVVRVHLPRLRHYCFFPWDCKILALSTFLRLHCTRVMTIAQQLTPSFFLYLPFFSTTQRAAAGERKRLDNKKALSQKKAMRRSRDSWD